VIGVAARVAPQKDFETLIRAAAIVQRRRSDVRLLIVGDHQRELQHRAHFASLKPLLRETRTEDYFHFAGFQEEMRTFFSAIDTFALSTHAEGIPLVILEAMAHRRPIVATAVGGIPEAIVNGRSALLVAPGDPQALATALIRLAEDPREAARLADAAYDAHAARFTENLHDERVRSFYARIAR
jgi:glycosyltransferase involved in cell wall biosynthesis